MLPFGLPEMLPGNHHMMGLDFDTDILFGNKIPLLVVNPVHSIYSNDMPTVCKFNDWVTEECDAAQLSLVLKSYTTNINFQWTTTTKWNTLINY